MALGRDAAKKLLGARLDVRTRVKHSEGPGLLEVLLQARLRLILEVGGELGAKRRPVCDMRVCAGAVADREVGGERRGSRGWRWHRPVLAGPGHELHGPNADREWVLSVPAELRKRVPPHDERWWVRSDLLSIETGQCKTGGVQGSLLLCYR